MRKKIVYIFTETVRKKIVSFYGKSKLSRQNETALQALKRTKAMKEIKETKIHKFDIDNLFVLLTFCLCYFQISR